MSSLKRIPELRRLSEDHHHGLVLARRARLAGEGNGGVPDSHVWEEIERRFRDELEPHFRIEEEYLAPPLVALGETELIRRFNRDHRMLRESVGDPSARSPSALKQFGEMLERHIRFEERELFETAQQRLSSDELRAIERACLRFPGTG
jgi:hypothetical protein